MTEPEIPVNQILRRLHQEADPTLTGRLPTLHLEPQLDQLCFDAKQIEVIFLAFLESLPLFLEPHPLILQTGVVGAPTLRHFGASSDGSFLTISLGSKSLPIGCIDHTPGSEFADLPAIKRMSKIVNELAGTFLVTDIGGKLLRVRCVLPVPNRQRANEKHGRETVLLVEDEEFVRNVTREVLELSGYTVLEAIDAEMGINIFQEHVESIDLLLTDVVMPGMNGHVLATKLLETSPALKVIFMSGYTENAITRQGFSDPRLVYLQKPFTLDVLTKKVREVLDMVVAVEHETGFVPSAELELPLTRA